MKRIILLEGADGGGKSTLAAELARRLDGPTIVAHHGPYVGETDIWRRYLESMLPAYADLAHVIFDRCWVSEPIYGAAFRDGTNRIAPWQRRMLERVALGRGVTLVYCRPPATVAEAKFAERLGAGEEMLESRAQHRRVQRLYDRALNAKAGAETLPTIRYDFTRPPPIERLVDRLLDRPLNFGPGLGRFAPTSACLVGERPGGFGGHWHLPFVSLSESGCSAWLATELERAAIPEARLYWVNASDGFAELDPRLFEYVGAPKKVIALGDAAAAWCLGRVEHVTVPHPQYWKRFQSKRAYPLLKELKRWLTTKR